MKKKQRMQGGVGEHHPEGLGIRNPLQPGWAVCPARCNHDGAFGAAKQLCIPRLQDAKLVRFRDVSHHQREGLPLPLLRAAQCIHGTPRGRVRGKVKSSDALEGHDPPLRERADGVPDGVPLQKGP